MKIEQIFEPAFQPVSFTITFESQEEIDEMKGVLYCNLLEGYTVFEKMKEILGVEDNNFSIYFKETIRQWNREFKND